MSRSTTRIVFPLRNWAVRKLTRLFLHIFWISFSGKRFKLFKILQSTKHLRQGLGVLSTLLIDSMSSIFGTSATQEYITGWNWILYLSFETTEKHSHEIFRKEQNMCSKDSWSARIASTFLTDKCFLFGKILAGCERDFVETWPANMSQSIS